MVNCYKIPFDSYEEAQKNVPSATKKYKMKMHAYECKECGKWHLSKFSRKQCKDFQRGKACRKGHSKKRFQKHK